MIVYSRFNCVQYVIENCTTDVITAKDLGRARRRMNGLRFDDEWLKRRLNLFKTYTYPSVMSQTDQDFLWYGLVHRDSPEWFVDTLKQYPRLDVKRVEMDTEAAVRGAVSVNLDTDDALCRDYIKEVRKLNFEGETIFRRGMRYRPMTGNWIGTASMNAHFNIVKHPELTVLDFSHGMYDQIKKQIVDHKRPMWLEVIHEENISNRMMSAKKDKNMGREYALQHFELGL